MPDIHSKTLSPSKAYQVLTCTNSMRLEQQFPDEQSEIAAIGTAGHAMAEHLINKYLGIRTKKPRSDLVDTDVMAAVEDYVSYFTEQIESARTESKDAVIYVEKQVSLEDYISGCFGTADGVIITSGRLHIIDLKLGFNPVSAERNMQLMIYALGMIDTAEFLFDTVDTVELTIVQPRIKNFSTWNIPVKGLRSWARGFLVPKAQEAISGNGIFSPGPDTCRYCKARFQCRARAEYFQSLATHDFSDPELLSDDEIAGVLLKVEALKKWAEEVYAYAEHEAITNHKIWSGFKVIRSTSRRKYSDEAAVIKAAKDAGYKNVTKESPITIMEMERLMGKDKFDEILGNFVIKPEGKLKLVPESEKGAPVNMSTAEEDFT